VSDAPGPAAPASPPQPASPEEAVLAIQRHRAAIVEAQHAVLQRGITVAEYNRVYAQHLAAIHALEAWLHDFQSRGMGGGAAGLY
jgi:hypothetical protein